MNGRLVRRAGHSIRVVRDAVDEPVTSAACPGELPGTPVLYKNT